ncbi:hypothetical protein [Albibacillus kandeliae]|uniref:hypothetical protein n=1 Tax=Albibacillus kandeliae TaxID=2174228 RepID=UPI000D689CBD|nr:hypothetical protein [Albibacillus kandeliae]
MRDFFISSFEKLVAVIVILMGIMVVIGALGLMFSGQPGGFISAIGLLIGGALYVILTGGMLYMVLGIYHNTKRTAEALERR